MQQRTGNKPPAKTPGRVSLPVTPPRGSPFEGISNTNAPAKNTKIPDLTPKVTLAKTRKAALTHGGLLTPEQQKAASDAGKALAAHKAVKRASETASKPSAKKPPGDSTTPRTLPLPSSAPFKVPPPSASASAPQPPPQHGRRGTPAFTKGQGYQGTSHDLLGGVANAASVGLGTGLSVAESVPRTLITPIHPGATTTPAEQVKPTTLGKATTDIATRANSIAAGVQGLGLSLPKTIPSVDLVAPAGAASTTITPQKLAAAGLSPEQTTKFRTLAVNKGWYKQEIDGLVGLDLIKHAYSSPPPLPIRLAQNLGAGVIRTGALANVPVAVVQEVASGHGTRAATEIGGALASQFGGMVEHPGQAFVSDPYTFVPTAGGALKTVGGVAGKALEKAGAKAVERNVALASTGAVVNRGVRSRNLYTASGQLIADKAAARYPIVARKAEANAIDQLVARVSSETAPAHHGVQTAYAKAFKSVGAKRAELLASINKAGGKPEKILAKYTRDGNERQVKHWTQVVAASKNLNQKDQAFLDAHAALGAHTTQVLSSEPLQRFTDTAGLYRAYQPLILSDAARGAKSLKRADQVHALNAGDPLANRVQSLHEAWVDALRKGHVEGEGGPGSVSPDFENTPNVAMAQLFNEYDQAVREYAAKHVAEGGIAPTRVAYTPPPSTGVFSSPYTKGTGGRVRLNATAPRQKASTGESFESGNYIIDPKAALRENLQAQRLRTSVGLTSDENLKSVGAIPAARGDERPAGYVFTPAQNPATVGKVISDLHDQPVGATDYYHQESSIRDRLAKHLEANVDKTGEHAATKGWFVPEGSWNRILDFTRPESRNSYDRFMRQYQRTMISIFPSTVLGNTLGSVPLALAAGAGPKSFRKAAESSSLGGDISLAPHSLHGRGVAGNLASDARNPLTVGMGKMRRANVIGEDFSRDAAYFSKAMRGAKTRSKELGYPSVNDYLRDMASGKVDPHIRDQAVAHAIKFAGDAAKPATKAGKVAGRFILFPQWLQHMTKLMLVTLPLHHPRRMALINALAGYGDQYRKEHGVLPSWMQEFAPLFQHTIGANTFTRVAGLGQLAPQGTAGAPFDTLTQNIPVTERIAGLLNPPVAGLANTAIQEIKNQGATYPVDLGRFAANQALYAIPGMSKFAPRTGMAPDSIPFLSERRRVYTTGAKKNKWNPNANIIPWDQRPGARPLGGVEGFLSRALGVPLSDVPTRGPINDATVKKQIKKSQPKTKGSGYQR